MMGRWIGRSYLRGECWWFWEGGGLGVWRREREEVQQCGRCLGDVVLNQEFRPILER